MALATKDFKFRGHCDARLYNTCSSIGTYGFPAIVNGPDDITISYDDAVDNEADVITAMSVEGWEPA